jgi:hypothetical protein
MPVSVAMHAKRSGVVMMVVVPVVVAMSMLMLQWVVRMFVAV